MRVWAGLLICAAAVCAAVLLSISGSRRGAALVQLLPESQIEAAEQLFSSAGKADKRLEKKVRDETVARSGRPT